MRLKTKLWLGLGALFLLITIYGVLSIISISRLKSDTRLIIKDNHETLMYSNNMLKALDHPDAQGMVEFEQNLRLQEANITEEGEREATAQVRQGFEKMKTNSATGRDEVLEGLQHINDLNQQAIFRKSEVAKRTAGTATTWLTVLFAASFLIALTLVVNIPGIISNPIRALSEGIGAIAARDYGKRIHLDQKDEFGDLADAFNTMAARLDDWENSNIARIRFEKSRIETIISQMRDAIVGLDEKGNILFMNGVAEQLTGLQEKNIAGKYAPDVALKNDLFRTLLRDNDNRELKIYADDKESFFTRESINVSTGEQVIGRVIVLRNITPFHELNEAKTNFIATVSHELKTPISSIKMSASLLGDERVGKLNTEQTELLKSISDDTERLLKITGELLNMTQVETGHIQLRIQPVQPADILEEALQAVQVQAQQVGIAIERQVEEHLPSIPVDHEKTSWVLINLLTNALKYAYENTTVQVSISREQDKIVFRVSDAGRGIDEKYLPRVFDRYYKVPGSSDKAGTGLGLSISKEFIEAQKGSMFAQSKPGAGSTFGFSLPVNG